MRAALRRFAPRIAEDGGTFVTGERDSVSARRCWAADSVSVSVSVLVLVSVLVSMSAFASFMWAELDKGVGEAL